MKFWVSLLLLCCEIPGKSSIQGDVAGIAIVNIHGVVVDSENLSPISAAVIYDSNNTQLAVTDKNGFFKASLSIDVSNDIRFGLLIKKTGYETFSQTEHWANSKSPLEATYYFALRKPGSDTRPFSELVLGESSSEEMVSGLHTIKGKLEFEKKVAKKKAGNSDLFFSMDSGYYLINDSGWLKLTSPTDTVVVNGVQRIPANAINNYVKRGTVKKMSPSSKISGGFEIETD